jgi:methyl-accepting chemotaxis protein
LEVTVPHPRRKNPRRTFLINRRQQIRTAVLVAGLVLVLVVVVNLAIRALQTDESSATSQSTAVLDEVMPDYDRNEMLVVILASVVVLAGVFVVTIVETHRTAGAAFALGRQMSRIADGHLDTNLTLRKGDNLRELEGPFNDMVQSLAQRATEDAIVLERLAGQLESRHDDEAVRAVLADLRELADQKRQPSE